MINKLRCVLVLPVLALLAAALVPAAVADELRVGTIFSSEQATSQSFLRFHNSSVSAGTVTVTLQDYVTGQSLGQWQSPSIAAGAEVQYHISIVENGTGGSFIRPSYYTIVVEPLFSGSFQHVLWKPADGTLTNLSTCASGVSANISRLIGVHSSLLDAGYPSTVVVINVGVTAATVNLGIYDARDGTQLGTYTTASIPAGGEMLLSISTIEAGIGITPDATMYHYNIQIEGAFNGFMQHLVNNTQVGVITDMSAFCTLTASSGSPATSFDGIVAGANSESGTLSVTVEQNVAAPASAALNQALSAYEKQQVIVQTSGTITLVGGGTVTLTGTYDTVMQTVNLSGSGYTFTALSAPTTATSPFRAHIWAQTAPEGSPPRSYRRPTKLLRIAELMWKPAPTELGILPSAAMVQDLAGGPV